MRLLGSRPDGDFKLTTFNNDIPPYAILSHTWTEGHEVRYDDLVAGKGKNLSGYAKLQFCGERAAADGLDYFWIDSCCIDKRDSVELSTALNSMFRWYQRAAKCYVYLSDVIVPGEVSDPHAFRITWEHAFRRSRWFTRGWTLQELLAPASVEFFSANGKLLGSKITLEQEIHEITQIPIRALRKYDLRDFGDDERMSWVVARKTTVEEDRAYCLLGIFGVFLPLIYGEGEEHALGRLKMEIQRQRPENFQSSRVGDVQRIAAPKLLPFPRNEFFVGRENHLRSLQEQLLPSGTHRRLSLCGLGGGGKTALVLELAYQMMIKHPGLLVFWVPAMSRETFDIAYREIGILLEIPGIMEDNADIKQLVRNSLDSESPRNWLMVIDNADDPNVLLESTTGTPQSSRLYDYIPRSDQGSILFTTRARKAAERLTPGNTIELEDMSRTEAKQLIERRIANKASLDDENATSKLLDLLTCLPLAIVQAIAFINSNQLSISDYVSLFEEADTEVEIFNEQFDDPTRYRETESTIAKTWQISFDQIRKQDQLAANYLSFMACIDRVNIPQSMLPDDGSKVQQVKALGTLTGYAFISEHQRDSQLPGGEKFFDVHRLVQKATFWWLKEHGACSAWIEKAYSRLRKILPYRKYKERQQWEKYLPHAIHVCGLQGGPGETREASLLDQIGRCQIVLGRYVAAEATYRQLLSLLRETQGDGHLSTLDSMNSLAETLLFQGKCGEAEILLRQMLLLLEKLEKKENPSTLMKMSNLGYVLSHLGRYEESEDILKKALVFKERVYGKNHPSTLATKTGIETVVNLKGNYEGVKMRSRRTLILEEKGLGREHILRIRTMHNLPQTVDRNCKESDALYRQALALKEKVFGQGQLETFATVLSLAHFIVAQDLYVEAIPLHQKGEEGFAAA